VGQFKRSGRMVTVCHSSTLDFRLLNLNSPEQSENVYENKGRGQEVQKPLTRLATLATLYPGRGLLTRFTREPEVKREIRKSGEQSENVYENKQSRSWEVKKSRSCEIISKGSGTPKGCHSLTLNSRLLDLNSTEQSENVYENKQLRSRGVEELRGQFERSGRIVTVCHSLTLDFST
jgi:hypothetical protein